MPFGVVDCAWSNAVTGRPRIHSNAPANRHHPIHPLIPVVPRISTFLREDYVTACVQISAHVLIDREDSVYQNEDIVEDTVEDC